MKFFKIKNTNKLNFIAIFCALTRDYFTIFRCDRNVVFNIRKLHTNSCFLLSKTDTIPDFVIIYIYIYIYIHI